MLPSPLAPAALRARLAGPAVGGRALRLGAGRCGALGEAMPGWQGLPCYEACLLRCALQEFGGLRQRSSVCTSGMGCKQGTHPAVICCFACCTVRRCICLSRAMFSSAPALSK